ncbi:hypothetical protein V5L91_001643, partial [Campylobacter upsaliensis]
DLLEKGAPDLFSGGKGIKLNERDEFDFAKELILKGQDSEEKFRLYQNLEELKAWSGEQKNTKLNTALKALDEVDESKLSEDQKELLRLFKGEIKSVKIQIKDLKDIYTLNQGSRKEGAKKILIKHYGEEKTGGLSSDELLSLKEVIKKGKINLNSLEIKDDFLRYGYDYEKDGVKLRVVIDEFKDGKKVFDYYSDRNFNHYEQGGYKPDLPTPSEIIPQNAKTSPYPQNADEAVRLETISKQELEQSNPQQSHLSTDESIAQNAKSERAEFESFKDKMKELYAKYEGLSPYDKSTSQLRSKLLNEEIEPEIKKEFKNIIDKFKGADNKDKILRVIKENKEELSDYLAFHIALRKDIYIDGYGEGRYDFYNKSIRGLFKLRENKPGSEIYDDSNYRTLAALENLSNKNTSLYFSFKDLNGKVGEFKTYPRIQDLLFYDLTLGYDLKNAVILSTKDKHLKEKLIEKLKAYIDKKIYADFLEYKIKDLESRNPKNSHFENYKDEKWDEEALKSFKKELEDLRANEKAQKLEAKGSEDIIFTDKKGKEHTLTKETQKAWLEAFGLKSLDEAYIPNFKAEVKEAINRVLGGEEIKLTKGSFEKLLKRDREEFLPYIKDTLEKANAVIKQVDGALIFAKDYRNERLGKFFASVSRNDEGEWIITSNAPKNLNNLKNKLNEGGELLYSDLPELTIIAKPDLDANALNSEANLKDIIAQKPQQKALNLQEIEQALKARKSQINDEISANDKAFKENLKEASKVKPILEALKNEWEALEPTIVTWTHTDYSKAKPKKYYKRRPNLSNLWHIEETLDVYKGYAGESDRHANQVAREIALLEKYVKSLKDKEAEVKAFKAKAEADENALILESRIISIYNQLREAFKKGHHTTKQMLEANNIKQDSELAKEVIDSIAQTRQYLEDTFNITPLKEFGTNYAEFYRDGKGAVEKLLAEKQGQVAGAFYKEGLGEIDLVWGDEKIGLKKIIEKHLSDFENFEGKDEAEKMVNALNEIIENGKIITENGINTLWLKKDDEYYLIGLSRGWSGKGENEWIITSYKKTKGKIPDELKGDTANLSAYSDEFNPLLTSKDEPLNSKDIIPQQKIKFAMEKF